MRHAMSPVLEFTAMSSPHGGCAQLYLLAASQKRPPSGVTFDMFGDEPGATTFSGRSGGSAPRPPRPPAAAPARPPAAAAPAAPAAPPPRPPPRPCPGWR